jgi:hypothetical protein
VLLLVTFDRELIRDVALTGNRNALASMFFRSSSV